MTEPGRKPVPGVVLHRPHLGGGTEPIRHPLGGPFVVGGEGHTHMAIVEDGVVRPISRSEEHTSELQSLMRISYAVFCLKKKKKHTASHTHYLQHQLRHPASASTLHAHT